MRKKIFVALAGVFIALILVIAVVSIILENNNIRWKGNRSYVSCFEELFKDMEEHYALSMHKEIDWNLLYDRFLPRFERAQENESKEEFVDAMFDFTQAFHDSHIIIDDYGEKLTGSPSSVLEERKKERFISCYDFAVFQLLDGTFIAVNVIEGGVAHEAGIQDGDEIISWNKKTVEEAMEELPLCPPLLRWNFANEENEKYLKPLYLTVMSKECLTVGLSDGRTVTMKSRGNGYEYAKDTMSLLLTRVNKGENLYYEEGMMHYEVREDYAYLCVSNLGSHEGTEFEQELPLLKAEMEQKDSLFLLLDLRNNSGGYDDRGAELLSYFTGEDIFYLSENRYQKETGYTHERDIWVKGKGMFDLPVIILVNSQTVSAGEAFSYRMQELPNVTVIGASRTNGSLATYEDSTVLPEGIMIHFPTLACMEQDGSILIDSGVGQAGGIEPDVFIPRDRTFAERMFENNYNGDYELEFAIEYEKKSAGN